MEQTWKELYPDGTFSYQFYDELLSKLYEKDRQTATLVNTSTIITIFISCIGLFGLMLFTAEKRAKEISIRKILGAGVGALLIALITISFHAAKAALASPVENLRSE